MPKSYLLFFRNLYVARPHYARLAIFIGGIRFFYRHCNRCLFVEFKIEKVKFHLLVYSFIFAFVGCQAPPTASTILHRSIQAHGFDQSLENLSYYKTTQLFYPDGTLEKEMAQTHSIQWRPFEYHIKDEKQQLIRKGNSIFKQIDSLTIEEKQELEASKNALNAAYFVFWQPAKLLDKKAVLTYKGKKKLQGKKQVDVLEVAYPESSSTDRWEFYFDPSSYLNLGYSVQHNGRWSLILNDEFHDQHRPILVKKRRSFFVDRLAQKTVLRATYSYDLLP